MTIAEFRNALHLAYLETRKRRGVEVIDILWCDAPIVFVAYTEIYNLQNVLSILAQVEQHKAEIGKANTQQFKQMLDVSGFF